MLYSRFFISLKPPLYVGLEVDTQQLNVPNRNITLSKLKINRTYIVLSYFSTLFYKMNYYFHFSKYMIYFI